MSSKPLALTSAANTLDENILVDALPYLDTNYNETDRQLALRLIEKECKSYQSTKNYLAHLPVPDFDVFLTDKLSEEMKRIKKNEKMPTLDFQRYELPTPSAKSGVDKKLWRKVIRNAKSANEHLNLDMVNLELLMELGPESYLQRNKEIEHTLTEAERLLRKRKEEVMEVHAQRKMEQTEAGNKLRKLEKDWVTMVTNNYRMELASNQMFAQNQAAMERLNVDKLV